MQISSKLRSFLICVGILVFAGGVVGLMGALKPEVEKEETTQPPLIVKTSPADYKEQQVFSTFQGEVRAKTNIELVTQVSGKVMSVSDKFIEGGEFAPGETLLQIDDSDYLVALRSAQASVAAAKVELDTERATAELNAKQWRELQNKPLSEASPLVLNKPQIDLAKARLSAAQAQLAAAQLNYDRTKISAPFSGRIMTKSAELGQFMPTGASIGRVFATESMEVRIPMTDLQISELGIRMGYSAPQGEGQGVPATISTVFGDEQRVWQGHLRSVDAAVDNETRLLFGTVVVEQAFDQEGQDAIPLAPGLFVDVQLASPNKIKGLELPRTALRNGSQVFVFDEDKLTLRSVKVIFTSRDRVIVANGDLSEVQPGELVITSPVPGAYEGMPVKTSFASEVISEDETRSTEESPDEDSDSEEVVTPESSSSETDESVQAAS